MIIKMTEPCILSGDIHIPTEMITKMTETNILCGGIN